MNKDQQFTEVTGKAFSLQLIRSNNADRNKQAKAADHRAAQYNLIEKNVY